jgi:hypothetical protein
MAIDLDAIRNRLQTMQQSSNSGGNSTADFFWKAPVGKSQIRIVPYAFDKSNPFIELYFHYEIAKRTMVSPISYGRPDPIVEFAEKLKKSGNKDDWKLGKKIEPKFRCYAPVIVRGQESQGVKFWAFGKQIYQELLGVIADPDYGDITDLMNGRDITIEHIAAEKEGAFPTYTVRVKPSQTPATADKDIAEMIVNKQKNITELFKESSYEEMTDVLGKWLNPETNESAPTPPQGSSITTATTATSVGDINSAFDALFNS